MKLDSTAAAYGLLQVVFADVSERLAYALFTLQQRRRPAVSFPEILSCKFSRLLGAFEVELGKCRCEQSDNETFSVLSDVCRQLKALSKWRNDRIHARVRQTEDGMALYESKTGKRLSISYVECYEILQNLTMVVVTLEVHLPSLIRSLDFNQELDDFFKGHFTEIEADR